MMRSALLGSAIGLSACGGRVSQMPPGTDFRQFVTERPGAAGAAGFAWRPDVCGRTELRPEYRTLDETSLVAFLRDNQLDARVERQPVEANKPELVFVFVSGGGAAQPIPLRVAILRSADEAGRALYDALMQRGDGAWGVHRANLAVLGPTGQTADDLAFGELGGHFIWGARAAAWE